MHGCITQTHGGSRAIYLWTGRNSYGRICMFTQISGIWFPTLARCPFKSGCTAAEFASRFWQRFSPWFSFQAVCRPSSPRPLVSPTGSFRAYTFSTLSEARSQLYRSQILQVKIHRKALDEIYIFSFAPFQISVIFQDCCTKFCRIRRNFC